MTHLARVTMRPTTYTVSLLPEDCIDAPMYEITVEYRAAGRWAVLRGRRCLSADGTWEFEPQPSDREDDWLDAYRFTLGEALKLAREVAPNVLVNGMTAAEVLAQLEAREATA